MGLTTRGVVAGGLVTALGVATACSDSGFRPIPDDFSSSFAGTTSAAGTPGIVASGAAGTDGSGSGGTAGDTGSAMSSLGGTRLSDGGAAGDTGGSSGASGLPTPMAGGGAGGSSGRGNGGAQGLSGNGGDASGDQGGSGVGGASENGGVSGEGGIGGTGGMQSSIAEDILLAHNDIRAGVDAMPQLEDLVWSEDLALVAQDWADTLAEECAAATTDFSIHHRPNGMYGENIASYLAKPRKPETLPADPVMDWASEVECWTFGTTANSSGNGGTSQCDLQCFADNNINSSGCGHYTQLAWRDTTEVGCAVSHCVGLYNGTDWNWDIWVCNYDPPGNVIGQAPF